MAKIKDDNLAQIAQVYNEKGRNAAYELIDTYGIKQPYAVMKRIKKHPDYTYDKVNDFYKYQKKSESEEIFMSIEELCSPLPENSRYSENREVMKTRTTEMENLIQELLGDRLLELSKYITLESSSKTMIIDQTSIKNAGYQIIMH